MNTTSMNFSLVDGLPILQRTPSVLTTLLGGIASGFAEGNEGADTWSPYIVVGHLLHGERADWIPRARIILEHGTNRQFEPFDRLAQFRESEGKSLLELLEEFRVARLQSLATLEEWKLTEAQLSLKGNHPAFGEVTLRQLLATWVAHDLSHLTQITRVMAKQYRDAVGPWRQYLSVMDR